MYHWWKSSFYGWVGYHLWTLGYQIALRNWQLWRILARKRLPKWQIKRSKFTKKVYHSWHWQINISKDALAWYWNQNLRKKRYWLKKTFHTILVLCDKRSYQTQTVFYWWSPNQTQRCSGISLKWSAKRYWIFYNRIGTKILLKTIEKDIKWDRKDS